MTRHSPVRRAAAALVFLAAALAAAGQPVTLRIAAYVPPNSPWDLGLRRLAAEFERVSGGQVKLSFPQSLKSSSEDDIIQKMKIGVDGALLTTSGLALIYPDSLAISMPAFVRNDAEYDAVMAAVEPLIKAELADRYEVLVIVKAGWVRYFSRKPIVYPADLDKVRMAVAPGDEIVSRLFQSLGARTMRLDNAGLMLQLGANGVDAFYQSPVFVASLWSQFKGKIGSMSPFPVSPFLGAIIFTRQAWDRVPASLRPALSAAARQIGREMAEASAKLDADSVAAISREGLAPPPYPAEAERKWNEVFVSRRASILSEIFSARMLSTIETALAAARARK